MQYETISADCMLFFSPFFLLLLSFAIRSADVELYGAQLYIHVHVQGGWCSLLHMGFGPT